VVSPRPRRANSRASAPPTSTTSCAATSVCPLLPLWVWVGWGASSPNISGLPGTSATAFGLHGQCDAAPMHVSPNVHLLLLPTSFPPFPRSPSSSSSLPPPSYRLLLLLLPVGFGVGVGLPPPLPTLRSHPRSRPRRGFRSTILCGAAPPIACSGPQHRFLACFAFCIATCAAPYILRSSDSPPPHCIRHFSHVPRSCAATALVCLRVGGSGAAPLLQSSGCIRCWRPTSDRQNVMVPLSCPCAAHLHRHSASSRTSAHLHQHAAAHFWFTPRTSSTTPLLPPMFFHSSLVLPSPPSVSSFRLLLCFPVRVGCGCGLPPPLSPNGQVASELAPPPRLPVDNGAAPTSMSHLPTLFCTPQLLRLRLHHLPSLPSFASACITYAPYGLSHGFISPLPWLFRCCCLPRVPRSAPGPPLPSICRYVRCRTSNRGSHVPVICHSPTRYHSSTRYAVRLSLSHFNGAFNHPSRMPSLLLRYSTVELPCRDLMPFHIARPGCHPTIFHAVT